MPDGSSSEAPVIRPGPSVEKKRRRREIARLCAFDWNAAFICWSSLPYRNSPIRSESSRRLSRFNVQRGFLVRLAAILARGGGRLLRSAVVCNPQANSQHIESSPDLRFRKVRLRNVEPVRMRGEQTIPRSLGSKYRPAARAVRGIVAILPGSRFVADPFSPICGRLCTIAP